MQDLKKAFEEELKKDFKGRRENAVKNAVCEQIFSFCEQNGEFLQAVKDSAKGLEDCCKAIMDGVGSSISDLEVYRRMALFYFPGSDVEMKLTINLSAEAERGGVDDERHAVVLDLFSELF